MFLWRSLRPKASMGKSQVFPINFLVANRKKNFWFADVCTFETTFVLCAREVLMLVRFSQTMLRVLFAAWFEDWWVASVAKAAR